MYGITGLIHPSLHNVYSLKKSIVFEFVEFRKNKINTTTFTKISYKV